MTGISRQAAVRSSRAGGGPTGGHVSFRSSHLEGNYRDARLYLQIEIEGVPGRANRADTIWFSVPADFHTHNDSVAAALMTLVGSHFRSATFNFPISRYCAELLVWYYELDEIGPIDDSLEPRRPGRYLALNFSGGLDSTAVWVLLRELARVTFKVVTTEYQGSALDRPGFQGYHRDVSTATNLRTLRYDRAGRFNCAAPLLFADYADLWGVASGHTMNHRPSSFERLAHGEQPAFLTQDATYNAGGLAEVHIVRGLNEPGTARLLVEAASERSAAALEASGFLGDRKRAIKSLTLRHFFLQSGRPVPEYLGNIRMPKPSEGRATELGVGFRTIWMYKRLEPEVMARIEPKLYETDLSSLADTSVEFFERYHTGYSFLMPAPLRRRVRAGLHAAGVYPYAERDYIDLETVRRYMAGFGMAAVSPSLRRPSPPPACWTPSAFDPLRLDV